MFSHHFEAAEATVLFVKRLHTSIGAAYEYECILDVHTQSGQTVRTTAKKFFDIHPAVGDVIKVQYDPKSQKVKLDTKGDIRYDLHARMLAQKAQHDAILSAPAGTPIPGSISQPNDEELDDGEELDY